MIRLKERPVSENGTAIWYFFFFFFFEWLDCLCPKMFLLFIHFQSSLWRSVVALDGALDVALDGALDTSAVDKLL